MQVRRTNTERLKGEIRYEKNMKRNNSKELRAEFEALRSHEIGERSIERIFYGKFTFDNDFKLPFLILFYLYLFCEKISYSLYVSYFFILFHFFHFSLK